MSSATSTDRQTLQPWQFFVLAGLGAATAATLMLRASGIAGAVLITVLMGAAALVGLAALHMLRPLVSPEDERAVVVGHRVREALAREKMLTLRSLKELEFDRAMGKLSDQDFHLMSTRLRARATSLMRRLDAGAGYRDRIEQDVAARLAKQGPPTASARAATAPVTAVAHVCASCATDNDADARFCKGCGAKL
jgi:hypothetical protein